MATDVANKVSTLTLPHGHTQWPIVKEKLQKVVDKTIRGLEALASVVLVSPEWGLEKPPLLNCLHRSLRLGQYYTEEEFGEEILPYIASRALDVERLFPKKSTELLVSGLTGGVLLTRYQASCILSLAFFHLLPPKTNTHGSRFHHLTLLEIFEHGFFASQMSKCLCLIGYFDRLLKAEKSGGEDFMKRCITIERRVLEKEHYKFEFWSNLDIPLCKFKIDSNDVIENSDGSLQVDFANEYIGGGVLQQGNVQEEIRFVINPECLVSLLYCEVMAKDEAILITGAEQFSSYRGYGGNFTYTGPYTDPNPVEITKNRCSVSIVAIDAIPAAWLPGGASYQFKKEAILREVCKAYCGFSFDVVGDTAGGKSRVPVATGNWGCGAFGGNKELKTLVQWMAGSQAGRDIIYYTFRDKNLSDRQKEVVECLETAKVSVGQLFQLLIDENLIEKITNKGVFAYVIDSFKPEI